MFRKAIVVALFGVWPMALAAQGVPASWEQGLKAIEAVQQVKFAALDMDKVHAEDMAATAAGETLRFAVPHSVKIAPSISGTLESLKDGTLVWRQRISAVAALSLNLGFERFRLAPGARLWIYTPDRKQVIGPLTDKDNDAHGQYWTPVLLGEEVVVELVATPESLAKSLLEVSKVNQGYRFFGAARPTAAAKSGSCSSLPKPGTSLAKQSGGSGYEKSGNCNMDVECLTANDPWRSTADAVGAYTRSGTQICSGALINNTAQDRRMLFMTANHCGNSGANAAAIVVYWNYQSPTCRTPGSVESGAAQAPYPLTNINSGAIFLAANATSDFNLVELDDPPPAEARLSWVGWNRTVYTSPGGAGNGDAQCSPSSLCAGIHHPGVDEKRITFVDTPMVTTSYNNPTIPGNASHVHVFWDATPVFPPNPAITIPPQVTEGGSSGSPLFDANHLFVGQLHGGPSACGSTGGSLSDYYGRLSVSWEGGGTAATRARDYLDPGNTGVMTLTELAAANPNTVFANGFE